MSGDGDGWAPGDLALCIKQGIWVRTCSDGSKKPSKFRGPKSGQILEVTGLAMSSFHDLGLIFDKDFPPPRPSCGWKATRFVKIPRDPLEEYEELEQEVKVPCHS